MLLKALILLVFIQHVSCDCTGTAPSCYQVTGQKCGDNLAKTRCYNNGCYCSSRCRTRFCYQICTGISNPCSFTTDKSTCDARVGCTWSGSGSSSGSQLSDPYVTIIVIGSIGCLFGVIGPGILCIYLKCCKKSTQESESESSS